MNKPTTQTERSAIEDFTSHDPTADEVADYIADMLQELCDLAKSSGLSAIGVLLELAEREARLRAPGERSSDNQ